MDIGNTNIKFCILDNEYNKQKSIVLPYSNKDEIPSLFEQDFLTNCDSVMIGSVVPEYNEKIQLKLDGYGVSTYFAVDYVDILNTVNNVANNKKRNVGIDIIANGVGVELLSKSTINNEFMSLVVDFGTATTFDLFDEKFNLVGTSIVPGITLSFDALLNRASMLPEKMIIKKVDKIIQNDTILCISSGMYHGYSSLVIGMIKKIQDEFNENMNIYFTGGCNEIIIEEIKDFGILVPDLTINGYIEIFKRIINYVK